MCLIRLSQFLSNHLMVHSNGVLQYLLHCNKSFNVICNWFLEKYPLSFLELFIYSFQLYRSFGYCYNLFILVFFMGINCKKKKWNRYLPSNEKWRENVYLILSALEIVMKRIKKYMHSVYHAAVIAKVYEIV